MGASFLTMEKAFSQRNEMDTTSSAKIKPDGTSSYVKGMTAGRANSLVGTVTGLISLIMGWRAKVRSKGGTDRARTGAIMALTLGLIGIVLSIVHLSTSYDAALGSGSGKAGAFVGLVLGFIGMSLSGRALRSKRV